MSKKNVVYILPHHDDEMFVIPKISSDLKNNYNLKFFFLMKSELRLQESRKLLMRLGVKYEDIISIGDKLNVADGSVHLFLDKIYIEIENTLNATTSVNEIICTAYEGGHNDHDIAAILARALAKKHNATVLEFYLYNGDGTRGKFYKVAHPVKITQIKTYRYTFKDFLTVLIAPFVYLSQMSAMLGLWPFLMLKILMLRPLVINVLGPQDLAISEHPSVPLYERWERIDQKNLFSNILHFLYTNDLLKNKAK